MDDNEIIVELEHLYVEVEETHPWEVGPLGSQFNDFLDQAKTQHPDDEQIQGVNEAPSRSGPQKSGTAEAIQGQIRKLARALGADMRTFGESDDTDTTVPETVVKVDVAQSMAISVDIDVIIEQVQDPETQELMKDFKQEVDSPDTDTSRLMELYERIYGLSATMAPHLFVYAAENGIDLLMANLTG